MENLSCRAWSPVEAVAQRTNLKVNGFQGRVSGQLFEFVLVLFDPQPDPGGIWSGTEGMHHPFHFKVAFDIEFVQFNPLTHAGWFAIGVELINNIVFGIDHKMIFHRGSLCCDGNGLAGEGDEHGGKIYESHYVKSKSLI